ncbi:MAG: hypothetical protein WCL27_02285 [Betaproteobacteria bacterium]
MAVDKTDKLARLREQQATLAAQIKAEEKKQKDREEHKLNLRRIEIGKLAEQAGVLNASDDVLLKAFKSIG